MDPSLRDILRKGVVLLVYSPAFYLRIPRLTNKQLACMVTKLASGVANTRTGAYNACPEACSDVSFSTMYKNIKQIWAIAGIGAYAVGNYAYDVWTNYGW